MTNTTMHRPHRCQTLVTATTIAALLALARIACAGQVLPLGPNTACTLAAQPEARKTFGVRRQHVLTCAGPDGTLTRVYMTRTGRVACSERLQVAADGHLVPIDGSCGARVADSATKAQDLGEPVNLSGQWLVDATFATCSVTVDQDGDRLSLAGDCGFLGTLSGSGTISFTGRTFTTEGPATDGIALEYCSGETVRMEATVSPDGQAVDGTVTCSVYEVPFRSTRVH